MLALAVAAATSLALTGVALRTARARSILDYPSGRSSHTIPTPRGGGIAICTVVLAAVVWLALSGLLADRIALAIGGGGLVIAGIGWLDDLMSISARRRLAVHLVVGAFATTWLGGMSTIELGGRVVELGMLGAVLGTIGITWATNLFNFMDGIDGIAAVEAVSVAGFGGAMLIGAGADGLGALSLIVAAACAGFLYFNWAPAKIFMGDVGSGFLGFTLACLAIASESTGGPPLLVWAILASAFITDASVTFARRLRRGSWRTAHRSHAYQRLVQAGWSHARVTSAVALLNGALAGMAAYAAYHHELLLPLTIAAFVTVGAIYWLVERVHPVTDVPGGR